MEVSVRHPAGLEIEHRDVGLLDQQPVDGPRDQYAPVGRAAASGASPRSRGRTAPRTARPTGLGRTWSAISSRSLHPRPGRTVRASAARNDGDAPLRPAASRSSSWWINVSAAPPRAASLNGGAMSSSIAIADGAIAAAAAGLGRRRQKVAHSGTTGLACSAAFPGLRFGGRLRVGRPAHLHPSARRAA